MKRRKFISKTVWGAMATTLGADIVYGAVLPYGYTPLALQGDDPFKLFSKDRRMVVLGDKPWNMEAKAHLLNDRVTPNEYMFIRNNGLLPDEIDAETWTLKIDGEAVQKEKTYTLSELKSRFKPYSYNLTLECAGNGRSEFSPPAQGNQWSIGAVSCAKWTGVRFKDVLLDVGMKDNAVYIGYHGRDIHLSRDPGKEPISRGVPVSKALQEETLLAFQMNDKDIPLVHGYPLRLVAGGWPASVSGKWINRISIRNRVHDGEKMMGDSYRIPCDPVAPGERVAEEAMCIIESMPVKSLITYPRSGAIIRKGDSLKVNGHAWAGEQEVRNVEYSVDFGSTWRACSLEKPVNRLAWQHFSATIPFSQKGYYEIWARATDTNGQGQPMVIPAWNPKGYLNNACHRIAIKVE